MAEDPLKLGNAWVAADPRHLDYLPSVSKWEARGHRLRAHGLTPTEALETLAAKWHPAPPPPPPPPPPPTNNPPADLAKAISVAAAGSTLDIRGGKYTGQFTVAKPLTLLGGEIIGRLFAKANDVTLDGLDIHGGTAAQQTGQIDCNGFDRLTLANVHSHDGLGSGVSVMNSTGSQIIDSELDHMDQQGYHFSHTTGLLFRGNKVHENNLLDHFSPGWEAGGGKNSFSHGAVFENNEAWGNHGPGLWDDGYTHDTVFRGNRSHDNTYAGIMVEIAFDSVVEDNVAWHNALGEPLSWLWASSILISSSTGVKVRNNVVYDSPIGIGVVEQDRLNTDTEAPLLYPPHDIRVEGNTVIACPTLIGFAQDYPSGVTVKPLFVPANNNGSAGNLLWLVQAEPTSDRFAWLDHWPKTLATFAGDDGTTRYLTTAEKDAALKAAGL